MYQLFIFSPCPSAKLSLDIRGSSMANIDHHFYEALGRDLHRQRMARKIKLQRVSDLTGLPPEAVSRYEKGDPEIVEAWDELCRAVGIDPDEEWDRLAREVPRGKASRNSTPDFEAVTALLKTLSHQHQKEAFDFIQFLHQKEEQ